MSDSRSREAFEAWATSGGKWLRAIERHPNGHYVLMKTQIDWEAWQAAEAETARRCAEIAGKLADEYRAKYKGTRVDGVRRGGSYDPHDDGMSDGAAVVEDAIRKEFAEAFK